MYPSGKIYLIIAGIITIGFFVYSHFDANIDKDIGNSVGERGFMSLVVGALWPVGAGLLAFWLPFKILSIITLAIKGIIEKKNTPSLGNIDLSGYKFAESADKEEEEEITPELMYKELSKRRIR